MKWLLTLGLVMVLASLAQAKLTRGSVPADQDFLTRQRDVIRLCMKVHEHNHYQEQVDLVKDYDPSVAGKFKDVTPIKRLMKYYNAKTLLPRGDIFSLFHKEHREEMILLFESFLFAQDWDTFFKTAVWARDRINEGQFVYALSVAVLHREDCKGIILPPAYEIYPHMFVNSEVINSAYKAKMTQTPAIIHMNFTGTIRNPDQWIAYLGEDVGLNSHHAHWHMDFPFWWKAAEYGIEKDRKGELFYYMHHQMIARYDFERLSNWLHFVEPISFEDEIEHGFYPQTTYRVGGEFPARPDNFHFHDLEHIKIKDMLDYTRRIKEAISKQKVRSKNGEKIPLDAVHGIDILGDLMEPSVESPHEDYYGSLHNDAHVLLGQITDPLGKFDLPPGVMEHFETATRDPAFFRLHKHIDNLFKMYKDLLPPYTKAELEFPGVKVLDWEIGNLVTYFEDFDIDMLNALDDTADLPDVDVKARVQRLNHEPFTWALHMESDKEVTAAFRVFLGPKKDWYESDFTINEVRPYLIEIDKFVTKVVAGKSVIHRKSSESSVTIPDRETTKVLLEKVEHALEGKETLNVNKDERHCGYPDRLLLPKGRNTGMPVQIYVIVTDFEKEKVNDLPYDYDYGGSLSYCGVVGGHKYPDTKAMGFPFDRRIYSREDFFTDNMYTKDVTITFKENHHH
uniref:Hemocyanin subunit 1 n=3 Tax=Plecoptera TaxID=50622 RepID=Q70Q69_PERMR|nr:hemocyanin subunit 1 [Perla marginata]